MIGTTLRHYRIVDVLGKGGMGEVYAAEDRKLNRRVALKVLPKDMVTDAMRLHRFEREAQAIAALNHPNVVTIYSVEEADGVHFLTMELVDGKMLGDLIPPNGLPFDEFLALAIPLADAIGAAHEHGVIHRDLKPANVMVGRDGRVKVLDFGLAKLRPEPSESIDTTMVASAHLTDQHHVIGTAQYMSPEQAEGQHIDHRTDIFSLGIVLFEMATGHRPFTGSTPMSIISSIMKDAVPPLTDVKPGISPELDRIIRRCLAKDPSRRYQSALDVRNELEELRTAAPVPSRRRLHPAWIIAPLLAILAIAATMLWRQRVPRTASLHPSFAQVTAEPGAELYPSISPDGKWVVYTGEGSGNRDIYLQSVSGENPINLTKDSPDDDEQPAFSPDGDRIAFRSSRGGGGLFIMGRTGEAVKRVTTTGFNPAWSPDGTQLLFTSERMELNPQNIQEFSTLWVVSANGGTPRKLSSSGTDVIQPNWSPHNLRIAYTARLGSAAQADIWTMPAGGGAAVAVTRDRPVDWNPVWSPDGKYLYFGSDRGGSMNLWRVPIEERSGKTTGPPEPITTPAPFVAHISISSDATHLAFSAVNRSANIQMLPFDPVAGMPAGEPSWVTTGSRSWSSPDPSPDGQWVAFYSIIQPEGHLYVVRSNGTELRQLTSDKAIDRMPRWSPDSKWIAFFSDRGGPLDLWKIRPDGSEMQKLTATGSVAYAVWSPDGTSVAAAFPGKLWRIDPNRPNQQPELLDQRDPQRGLLPNSWSPDGKRLTVQTNGFNSGVGTYTLATRTFTPVADFGQWPVWLPDGRRILFVSRGKEFWVADSVTKELKKVFSVTRDVIGPPRLTRDGRFAFYGRRVTEADVWLVTLDASGTAGTSTVAR